MKTTVVLDDKLVEMAIKAINARSMKDAIEAGLRELVRKRNAVELCKELGTYNLELTPEELKERRNAK